MRRWASCRCRSGESGRRRLERQYGSGAFEIRPTRRTQEPVGADLGKAPREDMLEEAREERVDRERHAPALLGARVGVP